ncbi:MAG: glycosyltransferase family 1 protein, partial [Microgenomates group bacterium]
KRIFYWIVFRKAVKASVKIIVPSKVVKKQIADYYQLPADKFVVTYEGLDEKVVPKGKSNKVLKKYKISSPYFVYAGNAYPHKNLERAIEAVVFLNKKHKRKILFAIASARSVFLKRLRNMISDLNAQRYVKLLGFVPDEDLGALFGKSVGFLFPSLSEGFGLPGLEAIAAGTIVLASDIPVFKEVYKDNILYFNPYDFSSIEKVMENAINMSKEERERLIEKSQKFIKRYSWAKMARQTFKIYEDSASIRQSK